MDNNNKEVRVEVRGGDDLVVAVGIRSDGLIEIIDVYASVLHYIHINKDELFKNTKYSQILVFKAIDLIHPIHVINNKGY